MARKMQSMRDRVRARAQEKEESKKSGFGYLRLPEGKEYFEPKKGTMNVDIVPYEVNVNNHPMAARGELWYERTFFIHRNIGADNRPYICPLKTVKQPCPICEQRAALIKDGYDQNKELIDALKPKERQIFNVDGEKGVQIYESSYYTFGEALEKEVNEGKDEWAGFADLEGGFTLRVRYGEKKLGDNTFLETERIDFEERDDYTEAILDEVADLDECLNILSYDELQRIFLEVEEAPAQQERRHEETRSHRSERTEREPAREEAPPARRRAAEPPQEEAPPTRRRAAEPPQEEAPPTRRRAAEPPKEEAPPARAGRATSNADSGASSGDPQCPGGGTYGTDCDKLDHCPECTIWEGCRDRADEMAASGRSRRR